MVLRTTGPLVYGGRTHSLIHTLLLRTTGPQEERRRNVSRCCSSKIPPVALFGISGVPSTGLQISLRIVLNSNPQAMFTRSLSGATQLHLKRLATLLDRGLCGSLLTSFGACFNDPHVFLDGAHAPLGLSPSVRVASSLVRIVISG